MTDSICKGPKRSVGGCNPARYPFCKKRRKHFLDINKTDLNQLNEILEHAKNTKNARTGFSNGTSDIEKPLSGKMVALIFEKPSTRTRVSFDMGVRQMGGQTMVLSGAEMQIGHGESIADTSMPFKPLNWKARFVTSALSGQIVCYQTVRIVQPVVARPVNASCAFATSSKAKR